MTDYTQDQILAVAKLTDPLACMSDDNKRVLTRIDLRIQEFDPLSNDTCVALMVKLDLDVFTDSDDDGWMSDSVFTDENGWPMRGFGDTPNAAALACAVKVATCEHGAGLTDYCLPCNRVNGG